MRRPLNLVLVDPDPTFRLGLRVCLEPLGLVVIGETSRGIEALNLIRIRQQAQVQAFSNPAARPAPPTADLVVLTLDVPSSDPRSLASRGSASQASQPLDSQPPGSQAPAQAPDDITGLQLCARLKTDFPTLKIIVLSDSPTPVVEAAARQMGADGFGSRAIPVRKLAKLVQRVASRSFATEAAQREQRPPIPGPLTAMRQSMRLSGLRQIEQAMVEVRSQQQQPISWITQTVLDGRLRELRAARWCVQTLWATPRFETSAWSNPSMVGAQPSTPARTGIFGRPLSETLLGGTPESLSGGSAGTTVSGSIAQTTSGPLSDTVSPMTSEPVPGGDTQLSVRSGDLQTLVIEGVFAKLQTGLDNRSAVPLEIDILRLDKKKELLFTILRQLEDLVNELRHAPISPGQLPDKSPQILSDLWERVIEDYFGKYYSVRLKQIEQDVVAILQQEKSTVQLEILSQIPLVPDLLAHWLYQDALLIDGSPYLATTAEAIRHSELLLENLILQIANAVVQPLLNRLGDVETIKKSFYHRRLMSTRDLEKFRNDLAWRVRLDRWVNEPQAIFESQYRLWRLTPSGIEQTTLYAPRREELDQLTGLQWAVTMALETRDALSPRVRAVFAFVGSGLVYVLTEVVGRGIGLIGRGVIQGVGSAWQDTRRNKRRDPYKGFNDWE